MKKLLITGTSGFVGSRIATHLAGKFDIIAPTHQDLEITYAQGCMSFIGKNRPDIILHLAAISDTGYCENHPQESMLVNVAGVENLAAAAQANNAK
ncbi:MAG: sugar nucleotide-binding protein, partial [Bacteroidales bacterium]|nr:sugar nucleotide-binding protein [Bacteroidales bacterium]